MLSLGDHMVVEDSDLAASRVQRFPNTHWSVVLAAGEASSADAESALEQLCRTYWYPLHAYVRRRGYSPEDAKDLTQEFFARLLAKNYVHAADRTKGKFRSFLLASMNHFLANEWDRARAQRRGGHISFVSLDADSAESRYLQASLPEMSSEKLFNWSWAATVLEHALQRLHEEMTAAGRGELFKRLEPFLDARPETGQYAAVAAELGWTTSGVAKQVHTLRQRYRAMVRREIAETVNNSSDIDEEMQELMAALG